MDARFYLVQATIAERHREAEMERLVRRARVDGSPRPPLRVRFERISLGRLFAPARRATAE